MTKRNTDHVVIHIPTKRMECRNCGAGDRMPLGAVSYVVGSIKAFVKAHGGCKPKKGDT